MPDKKIPHAPFDAAEYLKTPEAQVAYFEETLTESSPEVIARGLATLARANGISRDQMIAALDAD